MVRIHVASPNHLAVILQRQALLCICWIANLQRIAVLVLVFQCMTKLQCNSICIWHPTLQLESTKVAHHAGSQSARLHATPRPGNQLYHIQLRLCQPSHRLRKQDRAKGSQRTTAWHRAGWRTYRRACTAAHRARAVVWRLQAPTRTVRLRQAAESQTCRVAGANGRAHRKDDRQCRVTGHA